MKPPLNRKDSSQLKTLHERTFLFSLNRELNFGVFHCTAYHLSFSRSTHSFFYQCYCPIPHNSYIYSSIFIILSQTFSVSLYSQAIYSIQRNQCAFCRIFEPYHQPFFLLDVFYFLMKNMRKPRVLSFGS